MRIRSSVLILALMPILLICGLAAAEGKPPIYVGYDAEAGHRTSTSDDAIIMGIEVAMDEINRAGGLLGGRMMKLMVKDNRSVPARGVENIREFSKVEGLVAVVGGKFSPVMLEEIGVLHETRTILLDVWGAADAITENGYSPNYCFRVSLKDSWAINAIMDRARKKGYKKVGVLLPVTGWGRSNNNAMNNYIAEHPDTRVTATRWHNWGAVSLKEQYDDILKSGAEALVLVANEAEGSILVKEMAALPKDKRLPILSHWGVTGGDFRKLAGDALKEVDLVVVQTYSFFDGARPDSLRKFYATAGRLFDVKRPEDIPSPVGVAHSYDAIHILARAIELAGTDDRASVRDALEKVRDYDGLMKHYKTPFTTQRHDALLVEDLFMARFRLSDGAIMRARD